MIEQGLILEVAEAKENPFAAVAREYQRHGDKAVRRNRTKAALYFFEQALKLGADLNNADVR